MEDELKDIIRRLRQAIIDQITEPDQETLLALEDADRVLDD